MGKKLLFFGLIISLGFVGAEVFAANTATQTITFQINAVNELAVSGDPGALIISTATAGQEPDPATDSSTTLSLTTNEASKKVTGDIDSDMPANTTLEIEVTGWVGTWSSAGQQTLSTVAADLATGDRGTQNNRTITYTFSATSAAGTIPSSTRTATLTLTDQ